MDTYTNITRHGIHPNSESPCGQRLNQLFRTKASNWYLPDGEYLIECTLKVPSNTRLKLSTHATLRLADGAATCDTDYLLTNADPTHGNHSIHIEGGIFDGNQRNNPRPEGLLDPGYSGAMIHFENVSDLSLRETTLTNSEAYYCRLTHVQDFVVEGIFFDSDLVRKNNDGIHLGGNCKDGVIRRLKALTPGVTGDDMVALNADDALQRTEVRGMTNGPIENIQIEDVEAHSCHSFVRILSVTSPIRNITIKNIRGGCTRAAINADGARGCRVPVFDHDNPPFSDGVGILENIDISDARVWKAEANQHGLIDLKERMRGFTVKNFERILDQDLSPDGPMVSISYVDLESGTLNGDAIAAQSLLAPNVAYTAEVQRIEHFTVKTTLRTT